MKATMTEHGYDVMKLRAEFPILSRSVHGRPLVYLDNAATTQKPRAVIDAVSRYYELENANIHRGVHWLSEQGTRAYEEARGKVQRFLGAGESREIVFTRGTTEAVNLVANTFARARVGRDDEVLVTWMEHHSNIVPWQMLCQEKGARLVPSPIDDAGELILEEFEKRITPKTKFASVVHVSNALGTVNPVKKLVELCHAKGVPILVDGAQAVAHEPVDVRALDCDFYAFSGHKVYGPTGIGALYGKAAHLESMAPWQGGGDMILSVAFEKTTYNHIPHKFEAGTPHISGAIGLGAAIDWVGALNRHAFAEHERELLAHGTHAIGSLKGVKLIGTAREQAGVISFTLDGIHPHDVGTILDREGIAIRTGHHCAQPVMDRFGIPATVRVSLACYNTREEIDTVVKALNKVRKVFGG